MQRNPCACFFQALECLVFVRWIRLTASALYTERKAGNAAPVFPVLSRYGAEHDRAGRGKEVMARGTISKRKALKWGVALLVIAVLAVFGYRYWRHTQLYAGTDNAYINADKVEIAAQVSGSVTRIYVQENQPVKAGDPLFDIDRRPYELALEKAQAQWQLASQSVSQQGAAVAAAQAQVAQRAAELKNAEANQRRTRKLVTQGFLSKQGAEETVTQAATAAAALRAAQANLEEARSALGKAGGDNATIHAAAATLDQARLDLQHTHVIAPTAGMVTNFSLRPGNMVQAGQPLFVIISNQNFWVDANFKETELKRIHEGERAIIDVDMYPHHSFQGVVESLSGGSGTAFSLLPPQNATGNWVKVTQRVPVRIKVLDPDPAYPLRVGTTAAVSVRVSDKPGR
jgi:membrane fusion protein (multidrug efflux system)